jgi:hypothetical protein
LQKQCCVDWRSGRSLSEYQKSEDLLHRANREAMLRDGQSEKPLLYRAGRGSSWPLCLILGLEEFGAAGCPLAQLLIEESLLHLSNFRNQVLAEPA